jgi:hypothetical protein
MAPLLKARPTVKRTTAYFGPSICYGAAQRLNRAFAAVQESPRKPLQVKSFSVQQIDSDRRMQEQADRQILVDCGMTESVAAGDSLERLVTADALDVNMKSLAWSWLGL